MSRWVSSRYINKDAENYAPYICQSPLIKKVSSLKLSHFVTADPMATNDHRVTERPPHNHPYSTDCFSNRNHSSSNDIITNIRREPVPKAVSHSSICNSIHCRRSILVSTIQACPHSHLDSARRLHMEWQVPWMQRDLHRMD